MASRRRVRTVGAIVVNPRRRTKRRNSSSKRSAAARKGARTKARNKNRRSRAAKRGARKRRNPVSKRRTTARRRRNPIRRRRTTTRRRTTARRRNPVRRRRTTRKRRNTSRRRNTARRNPIRRRRRSRMTRRNPMGGFLGRFQSGLRIAMSGLVPSIVGALAAVELPIQAAPWLAKQSWAPAFMRGDGSKPVYFLVAGVISGALVYAVTRNKTYAASTFSAAAGAAYYCYRSTMLANGAGVMTAEQQIAGSDSVAGLGALVMSSQGRFGALTAGGQALGMGPAYSVGPQGYGAVVIGA